MRRLWASLARIVERLAQLRAPIQRPTRCRRIVRFEPLEARLALAGNAAAAADDVLRAYADIGNPLDVLSNDRTAGTGESLSIVAIGVPSHGTALPNGSSIMYRPFRGYIGPDSFTYTIRGEDGEESSAQVAVTVYPPTFGITPYVDFTLKLTKPDGSALTSLAPGQDFVLHVFTQDKTEYARGVYAAYVDVSWDSGLATVAGAIKYGSYYPDGKSGSASVPGLIDEAGAFAGIYLDGDSYEVFSVPMRATNRGDLVFRTNPADLHPDHNVLVSGISPAEAVPEQNITYGSASLRVGTFVPGDDTFSVDEDTKNNVIFPLVNDTNPGVNSNTLTISAVGATGNGGSVTIAADRRSLRYTPMANFRGVDTFTYSVRNADGEIHTATIKMEVADINDPPIASDDSFDVSQNTVGNVLQVLSNDSTSTDEGETLHVTSISAGNHGGTVVIGANGDTIIYAPAIDFVGVETFTYTISDRAAGGLMSTATVSITVSGVAATQDTFHVEEGNGPFNLDVLKNDIIGPQQANPATIVSVGVPNCGGSVAVASSGMLSYTPRPGFHGTESFTYSIHNGQAMVLSSVVFVNVSSPQLPGVVLDHSTLRITGSSSRDRINVMASHYKLIVSGTLGATRIKQTFYTIGMQRIVTSLGDGNDTLTIQGNVRIPIFADGGKGNDTIIAGGGSAVLLGNDGNDVLIGSNRRDVLIGGTGRDQLSGLGASDLLIGGRTAFDSSPAALLAIQGAWNSSRSPSARVADLRQGSGPILPQLGIALQQNKTVFDDGDVDALFGGSDVDWFFSQSKKDRHDRGRAEPLG